MGMTALLFDMEFCRTGDAIQSFLIRINLGYRHLFHFAVCLLAWHLCDMAPIPLPAHTCFPSLKRTITLSFNQITISESHSYLGSQEFWVAVSCRILSSCSDLHQHSSNLKPPRNITCHACCPIFRLYRMYTQVLHSQTNHSNWG